MKKYLISYQSKDFQRGYKYGRRISCEQERELKETLRQFISILESEIYDIGWKLMEHAKQITEYEKN